MTTGKNEVVIPPGANPVEQRVNPLVKFNDAGDALQVSDYDHCEKSATFECKGNTWVRIN